MSERRGEANAAVEEASRGLAILEANNEESESQALLLGMRATARMVNGEEESAWTDMAKAVEVARS